MQNWQDPAGGPHDRQSRRDRGRGRARRLRVVLGRRAPGHSGCLHDLLSALARRQGAGVLRSPGRSVRRAGGGRAGDLAHPHRHQRLSAPRAQSDRNRQGRRDARHVFGRPADAGCGRGMVSRRGRDHGRRLQAPLASSARVRRGDARVVEQARGELRRRDHQVPSGQAFSQAGAEAISADFSWGARSRAGVEAGRPMGGRMDAGRPQPRKGRGVYTAGQTDGAREWTRPRAD